MKRIIAVILALTLCLCFAACSKGGSGNEPADSNVNIETVYAAISPIFENNDPREHDADFISNLYGINTDLIKSSKCVTYDMGDYAFSGEIVMIEAVDKDAAQTAYDALSKRLDDMKKQLADYEGASIDNELANKIEILQKGNCVAFFYSDHYDDMVAAFNK